MPSTALLLLVAGGWAGAQNALAGGGSFITIPALMLAGLDARAANITSSVALYPAQLATGFAGRDLIDDGGAIPFRWMCIIGAAGGAAGAILLLLTSSATFERLLPWLILFATLVFAWSAFRNGTRPDVHQAPAWAIVMMQSGIAVYGGYFGGGLGFMMVAALNLAGLAPRKASATKNMLAAVINTSSLLIFVGSSALDWSLAGILTVGAVSGGLLGTWLLKRIAENLLRFLIIGIGVALTVVLFAR